MARNEQWPVTQLIVIVGAGGSRGCASHRVDRNTGWEPPLVKDLFTSAGEYPSILNEYPLAKAAAADIRPVIESGVEAIEEHLRTKLRDSKNAYARRRYMAVPLYLQHLLFSVGQGYTEDPDNYERLINRALELDEVVLVTLNYDTILDECLAVYSNSIRSTRTSTVMKSGHS